MSTRRVYYSLIMSLEYSSVMVEGPEATLKALSELTAGATLLKAGRSVRNFKKSY